MEKRSICMRFLPVSGGSESGRWQRLSFQVAEGHVGGDLKGRKQGNIERRN